MKQLDFVDQVSNAPAARVTPARKAKAKLQPKRKNRAPGSRDGLQRLNMEIPKALHKRLKLKAIYEDRTVTDIVLQAINEYLHSH